MRYSNRPAGHPGASGGIARLYASDVPGIHQEIVEEARRLTVEAGSSFVAGAMGAVVEGARSADRYLVSRELAHVVVDAARDVPATALAGVCPSLDGVLVYSGGLPEVDGPGPAPLPTLSGKIAPLAVTWTHVEGELSLVGWAHVEADAFDSWVPAMGDRIHDPTVASDPDSYLAAGNGALCALVMSTWQLMRTSVARLTTSGPPPAARKRGRRAEKSRPVQVLELSEQAPATRGRWVAGESREEGGGAPWEWVPPQHLSAEEGQREARQFVWRFEI